MKITVNNTPLCFPIVPSCRSDFPTERARAKTLVPGGSQPHLVIPITRNLLPYWVDAIRVGTGTQMDKLTVQKVEVADLLRDQSASPTFTTVWRRTPGSNTNPLPNYAIDADDKGTVNFGTLPEAVADRIVLLSIGK